MDSKLFFSTFALIFIAELPDKTAFATLLMATRGSPLPIFVGVAAAFVVQTLVAVLFGGLIAKLPSAWVHLIAGLLFIVFAIVAWRKSGEPETEGPPSDQKDASQAPTFIKAAVSSFIVIFIAEWGDLTQLASASLAARYNAPLTIFFASVAALWSVTALAIIIGRHAKHIINPALIQKIAALAFAGVGVYFIYEWASSIASSS